MTRLTLGRVRFQLTTPSLNSPLVNAFPEDPQTSRLTFLGVWGAVIPRGGGKYPQEGCLVGHHSFSKAAPFAATWSGYTLLSGHPLLWEKKSPPQTGQLFRAMCNRSEPAGSNCSDIMSLWLLLSWWCHVSGTLWVIGGPGPSMVCAGGGCIAEIWIGNSASSMTPSVLRLH